MIRMVLSLAVIFACTASFAVAADSTGLEKGDQVGAFYVTKVTGDADDGVSEGEKLCYRCKYGSRPMVMIFTRESDGKLQRLVKQLDKAITENEDSQLRGFVTVLGSDSEKASQQASEMAKATKAENVPFVVAEELEKGPASYKLGDEAVTVIIASDGQVVSKHAGDADELDLEAVMKDVRQAIK